MSKYPARNDLRSAIVSRGLKFKDVAYEARITPTHLGAVLNGRDRLTPRMERDITRAIEVLADEAVVA